MSVWEIVIKLRKRTMSKVFVLRWIQIRHLIWDRIPKQKENCTSSDLVSSIWLCFFGYLLIYTDSPYKSFSKGLGRAAYCCALIFEARDICLAEPRRNISRKGKKTEGKSNKYFGLPWKENETKWHQNCTKRKKDTSNDDWLAQKTDFLSFFNGKPW